MGIPIYEGSKRIVLPHGDKSVPPTDNPFCFYSVGNGKGPRRPAYGESAFLVHVVGPQF